eukprot:TRINITY_DN8640_c0_g1_i1.p1 TRINITY_DN8640_c0_g1~~TRINITY_DN8640_c0_g1_i1.p1  ORF type:complete len:649 (-),score=95.78 TRINITY_DN8640_c0_g1_i1:2063-4009(-)
MSAAAALIVVFCLWCHVSFGASAQPSKQRSPLASTLPHWATAESLAGTVPPTAPIRLAIYLSWRNRAALVALATAVSTPGTPQYGKFFSPAQFRARFAPKALAVQKLSSWLQSQGFRVVAVPMSNKHVIVKGKMSAAVRAFGTRFAYFKVRGMLRRAPLSVPSIPLFLNSLGSITVHGLVEGDSRRKPMGRGRGRRRAPSMEGATLEVQGFGKVQNFELQKADRQTAAREEPLSGAATCSVWTPATTVGGTARPPSCGYTTAQLRSAYGVPSNLTGKSQTIAIITAYASPFMQNDLSIWAKRRGIPSSLLTFVYPSYNYSLQQGQLNPAPGYDAGWQQEEAMDIEVIHGIAPDAKLYFFGAASDSAEDLNAALGAVLDYGVASLVSNSYGSILDPSASQASTIKDNQPTTDLLLQAAVQGVGVFFSAGDDGDNYDVYGAPAVAYPACDPWAVAVGGTTLAISSAGKRLQEVYWGEKYVSDGRSAGGGGGGVTGLFPVPAYQNKSATVQKFFSSYWKKAHGRTIPDISANADPNTGAIVGFSTIQSNSIAPQEAVIGGTSLSCPIIVALVALAQQLKGRRLGFLNPKLYSLRGTAFIDIITPAGSSILTDVYGERIRYAVPGGLIVAPGFDSATGLGVPSSIFLKALAS